MHLKNLAPLRLLGLVDKIVYVSFSCSTNLQFIIGLLCLIQTRRIDQTDVKEFLKKRQLTGEKWLMFEIFLRSRVHHKQQHQKMQSFMEINRYIFVSWPGAPY